MPCNCGGSTLRPPAPRVVTQKVKTVPNDPSSFGTFRPPNGPAPKAG